MGGDKVDGTTCSCGWRFHAGDDPAFAIYHGLAGHRVKCPNRVIAITGKGMMAFCGHCDQPVHILDSSPYDGWRCPRCLRPIERAEANQAAPDALQEKSSLAEVEDTT